MPAPTVPAATHRARARKPQGSCKTMPEVWDPPRFCERDGRRIYAKVGDDRILCRHCQRELARASA
jgi:hypothetical protein